MSLILPAIRDREAVLLEMGGLSEFFLLFSKSFRGKLHFHGRELPLVESQLTFRLLEFIIFDDSRNRFSIKAFDALSFWKTF